MGRRGLLTGTSLLLVAVAACGEQGDGTAGSSVADDSAPTTQAGAHPWLTADGDTLVTCSGDPAFPASRVAEGGLEFTPEASEEILATLEQMKQDFGIDAPRPLQEAEADQVPWAVLWEESVGGTDQVGIIMAEPGATGFDLHTDEYASLEWDGASWRAMGWSGTCGARPALTAGLAWAQVALPEGTPASSQPTDQATTTDQAARTDQAGTTADATLELMVTELDCTSARDPEPFLGEPVVIETAEAVTVHWTTEAMTGGAGCPGNPWVPRTITLEDPLGDRELLDGSTYPPQVVRTVTEIESGPPA